jgi:hypothetical protein
MNCHDAKPQLVEAAYGDGEESSELQAHLAGCESCLRELAALRDARAALCQVAPPDRPALPVAALLAAAGRRAEREGKGWRRAALAAAALAATLLVGWTSGLRIEPTTRGIAIVWGQSPSAAHDTTVESDGPSHVARRPADDPWPLLRRVQERLDHQEKVLGLLSADAVASEGRTSRQLAHLKKELRELRSSDELLRLHLAVVANDLKQLNSWAAELATTKLASTALPAVRGDVDLPND